MTGGLILKQGDIEVNCTVDTLLDLSRSSLPRAWRRCSLRAEAAFGGAHSRTRR